MCYYLPWERHWSASSFMEQRCVTMISISFILCDNVSGMVDGLPVRFLGRELKCCSQGTHIMRPYERVLLRTSFNLYTRGPIIEGAINMSQCLLHFGDHGSVLLYAVCCVRRPLAVKMKLVVCASRGATSRLVHVILYVLALEWVVCFPCLVCEWDGHRTSVAVGRAYGVKRATGCLLYIWLQTMTQKLRSLYLNFYLSKFLRFCSNALA